MLLTLFTKINWLIENSRRDLFLSSLVYFQESLVSKYGCPPTQPFLASLRSLAFPGSYPVKFIIGWAHRKPSIIDDLSLDRDAYCCPMAGFTWVGRWEPSGQTTMPCVSSITLPKGVHISERSADLAVVRCREMEGGGKYSLQRQPNVSAPYTQSVFWPKWVIGSSTNWHPPSPLHMAFSVPGRLTL